MADETTSPETISLDAYNALKESNDKLVADNADLTTKLEQSQEAKEALAAENETLHTKVADHLNTIMTLRAKMIETGAANAEKELPKIPAEPVVLEGKSYRFTKARFILPGIGEVKAQDAAIDNDIIKAIIDIKGQTILKELL
ncbi:MAG TPA: hypothetical protein VG847_13925 [Chitinophagaceae bacterium]|nr:hypothetical protein [Chitinophagaceae bacterium]